MALITTTPSAGGGGAVTSVFGRVGAVVATAGDYTGVAVGGTADALAALALTDGMVAAANKDGTAATPSLRTLGSGAQQACGGADARLSDSRTPTAHEATHKSGGSDPFLSTDVLEAIVKRLQESGGPTTLLLGAVTDGQFLKRSGTSIVGAAAGGVTVYKNSFDIVNTAVETALISQSIPGGTLGANGMLEIIVAADYFMNATVSFTLAIKLGATTLWSSSVTPANNATHHAFILNAALANEGATNAQRLSGLAFIGPATAATNGLGPFGTAAATSSAYLGGSSAIDTTGAATLAITATWGGASVSAELKGAITVTVVA